MRNEQGLTSQACTHPARHQPQQGSHPPCPPSPCTSIVPRVHLLHLLTPPWQRAAAAVAARTAAVVQAAAAATAAMRHTPPLLLHTNTTDTTDTTVAATAHTGACHASGNSSSAGPWCQPAWRQPAQCLNRRALAALRALLPVVLWQCGHDCRPQARHCAPHALDVEGDGLEGQILDSGGDPTLTAQQTAMFGPLRSIINSAPALLSRRCRGVCMRRAAGHMQCVHPPIASPAFMAPPHLWVHLQRHTDAAA